MTVGGDPAQSLHDETAQYRAWGYVALDGLSAPAELDLFYARMRDDIDLSETSVFATRSPLFANEAVEVYSARYAPMLALHWKLTARIEAATGCKLLPTYAYFRRYGKNDVCRIHSDRHACEHSLSLTLAYADDMPWALSVATESERVPTAAICDDFGDIPYASVAMLPGDAVLYQGIHHRHGRLDPNPNAWSAHLFLHWVDAQGPYRDQAFDRSRLTGTVL